MDLPEDVYKGNGRIKHELIDISVGPLLSVKLMSFQSKLKSENNDGTKVGDNDHFELHVYRNCALIGGEPVQIIKIDDIMQRDASSEDYNVQAREQLFLDFLNGDGDTSSYPTHYATIKLVQQMYRSLVEDKKIECSFTPYELPKEKGMLIVDSEGTLKKNGVLLKGIVSEIVTLDKNNVVPVLATGLPLYIAKAIGSKFNAKYIISAGGAQIYDVGARQTIYYKAISSQAIHYIINNKPKFIDLAITCKSNNYVTNINETVSEIIRYVPETEMDSLPDICHIRFRIHQFNARDNFEEVISMTLKEGEALVNGSILNKDEIELYQRILEDYKLDKSKFYDLYKVVQTFVLKKFKIKMLQELEGVIHLHNESSNFNNFNSDDEITWFTVVDQEISKGNAIGILKDYLCFNSGEKVLAIGNANNDFSMLEVADISIFIGNKCSLKNCFTIDQNYLTDLLKFINLQIAQKSTLGDIKLILEKSCNSQMHIFAATLKNR